MAYVIAEPCIGVKDASCVEVCPIDCIASNDDAPQYYIDATQCIDCAACEMACPVSAIAHEDSLQPEWTKYIQINADFYR